ncbi:MAG: phosphotransferase [bacterium]|nr:phosphotransferase [bacterium]
MIAILTKLIKEHPEWLHARESKLSFMKTSTPASGTKVDQGKVLIFVFEEEEKWPTLCVKTTRTYAAGESIRENHHNLQKLQEEVKGSVHSSLFALPLYLYDDGKIVFCIESVCPGVRFSASTQDVELVMENYIAWQSHLAQNTKEFQTLPDNIRLPVITQHGDMTPDNVLVSEKDIYLIDYDYAGVSTLAGFDLFNFLSKIKLSSETLRLNCGKYFPRYFESIGAEVGSYEALLPLYHQEEVKRKDVRL